MLKMIFRPWVITALLGFAAYAAQLAPIPGIFLMMLGGMLWPGGFLHLTMILLVIDCVMRWSPRVLLVAPLAFYGFGLSMYAKSQADILALSQVLAQSEAAGRISYDSSQQVIVFNGDDNSDMDAIYRRLQSEYLLDLAFIEAGDNAPTPLYASHVLPRDECPDRRSLPDGQNISYFRVDGVSVANACMLRTPQRLDRTPIVVSVRQNDVRPGPGAAQVTTAEIRNGEERAVTSIALTRVYPPIPFLIAGCALNSGEAKWQCFRDFATTHQYVDANGGGDEDALVHAVARALGLQRRTVTITCREQFGRCAQVNFAPDPNRADLAVQAEQIHAERLEAFFAAVPGWIAAPGPLGGEEWRLADESPERNGEHAIMLIDGVGAMLGRQPGRDVRRVLTRSVIVLPDQSWQLHRYRILRLAQDERVFEDSPGLLARLGDYGVSAIPVLLRELQHTDERRAGALLGLCRVGAVANTPTVRAAMQAAWSQAATVSEGMFVALLRMGDREAAAAMPMPTGRFEQQWRAHQLDAMTPDSPAGMCRWSRDHLVTAMPRDMRQYEWRPPR